MINVPVIDDTSVAQRDLLGARSIDATATPKSTVTP